jgi:hypothetical protein
MGKFGNYFVLEMLLHCKEGETLPRFAVGLLHLIPATGWDPGQIVDSNHGLLCGQGSQKLGATLPQFRAEQRGLSALEQLEQPLELPASEILPLGVLDAPPGQPSNLDSVVHHLVISSLSQAFELVKNNHVPRPTSHPTNMET